MLEDRCIHSGVGVAIFRVTSSVLLGDKWGTREGQGGDEDTKLCYRKFVIEVPENLCTF